MVALERTHNAIVTVPIETKWLDKGHIFIEDEISCASANETKKQIMYLVDKSPDKFIYIHVNSPGGDITAGLMLYDIVQTYSDRIYTICTGQAYSMAAVLVACAAKGKRYILPNSEMMIHEPSLGNRIVGSCSSIKATSDRLVNVKEKISKILSIHTGKSKIAIDKATSYDHFFSAKESVRFGLCDKIIRFNEIMGGKANG